LYIDFSKQYPESPQKYNNDDLELPLRIQHKRKKSMQLGIAQEIISKGLHEIEKSLKKMDSINSLKPINISKWQCVFLFLISSVENSFFCEKLLEVKMDTLQQSISNE